jgi:hypothetical protein
MNSFMNLVDNDGGAVDNIVPGVSILQGENSATVVAELESTKQQINETLARICTEISNTKHCRLRYKSWPVGSTTGIQLMMYFFYGFI